MLALCGGLPAGALYCLMRPTVLPDPGIKAYRPPRADSTFPPSVRQTRDSHTLSISAGKRDKEQVQYFFRRKVPENTYGVQVQRP